MNNYLGGLLKFSCQWNNVFTMQLCEAMMKLKNLLQITITNLDLNN